MWPLRVGQSERVPYVFERDRTYIEEAGAYMRLEEDRSGPRSQALGTKR